MINIAIVAAVLSVVMYIIHSIGAKKFASSTRNYKAAAIVMGISIIPMVVIAYFVHAIWISGTLLLLSIVSGIFMAAGFILYYKSLHTEQVTNASGFVDVGSAILIVFGVLVLHETISVVQFIGIIMIFIGAYLIIINKRLQINKRLIPSLIGNVSFSIFWIISSYIIISSNNFVMTVLISRIVATLLALICIEYLIRTKHPGYVKHRPFKWKEVGTFLVAIAVIAGIADGFGDTLFAFVTYHGYIAVASALGLFVPIGVSIIAYFLYKDRLTKIQLIGLILAIAGALVLTVL